MLYNGDIFTRRDFINIIHDYNPDCIMAEEGLVADPGLYQCPL